jgi:hypothetical protein
MIASKMLSVSYVCGAAISSYNNNHLMHLFHNHHHHHYVGFVPASTALPPRASLSPPSSSGVRPALPPSPPPMPFWMWMRQVEDWHRDALYDYAIIQTQGQSVTGSTY